MSSSSPRLLVTAATGQLGRLVVAQLLQAVPAERIAVAVRDPAKAADWARAGVQVHRANYDDAAAVDRAMTGIDRVLLISSSEMGRRTAQHGNVIDAARRAGVKLLAYTSVLRADTSKLPVVDEHLATEGAIRASGVPFALLRNGWYTENYTAGVPAAVAHGAVLGSSGAGRISAAARADYAAAAVAVLTTDGHAGHTYELAGDTAFTMAEFAAEVARRSGRPVVYKDLPEPAFGEVLAHAGLPGPLAALIASCSAVAAGGELFDDGHHLSHLIGRPTTPWADTIAAAVRG